MKKIQLFITIILFAHSNSFAQYTKLIDFKEATTGIDPCTSLISVDSFLYGMTYAGGTSDDGTIFKIKCDGTEYTKLLDFDSINGANPFCSLIYDGTYLYGTTENGGVKNKGTIFKIKPDGTGYFKLWDFDGKSMAYPSGSLFMDGNFLYGTTGSTGGTITNQCFGSFFKIKPNGTNFDTLLNFTNANESSPMGDLTFDGTFLYGITNGGGSDGTIFKIEPNGINYSHLLNFNGTNGSSPNNCPYYDGNFLYQVTPQGGTNSHGTLFKLKSDGTGYLKLLDFDSITNGSTPMGTVISDGTFLYGTTLSGGMNNCGTIYKIKIDGTGYVKLYDFDGTNGRTPSGSLISDGTFLYGMTQMGGVYDDGTIFKYQYCTTNCCFSHYTTAYDTLQNIFTLTIDASTVSVANSYHWDFGDGSTSIQATPTHIYTKDSSYNICLKVKTANSDSCSYCHIIGKDAQGNIYRLSGFTLKVVNASPLGIENSVSNETVSIFPNPTNGNLTLTLSKGEGNISICNVLGEKIHQSVITNQQLQIDLGTQPNGVYFLSIQTKEGEVNKKIVVSH